jgi:hypothetical protein
MVLGVIMTAVVGYVTFDTVDSDLEVNLGGEYSDFEFAVSGRLDTNSSIRRRSDGIAIDGGFQGCTVDCSSGSTHRNLCLDDRIVKVQEYISSNWVTVLEVAFIAATSTGMRVNVITANANLPVLVKART